MAQMFTSLLTVRLTHGKLSRRESPIFDFNGGHWILNNHDDSGGMPLNLQKVAGECRYPFSVTVKVEGVPMPDDLSQETDFTDDFPTLAVHRIWEKQEEEIVQAVPEFPQENILVLNVTLEVEKPIGPCGEKPSKRFSTRSL